MNHDVHGYLLVIYVGFRKAMEIELRFDEGI